MLFVSHDVYPPLVHRLPTEILIHILSYLGCADVMEASKTCRELYRLCQDNDVWHALFSRRYFEITPAANTPCMRKLFQDHAELDRRWRDGEAYATFLDGDQHQDSVYALKYLNSSDPSGVVLVSGSRDRTLRIWRDGFAQPQVIETPHQGSVLCLATSSSWVVSGSSDTTCVVWSLPDWQPTHVLRGHTASVVDVCFVTPNAIATGSKDGSLRIWYLEEKDWQAKQIFLEAHARSITAIQTWGKHHVVSASADEKVKIWCLQTEQCVRTLTSNVGGLACLCVTDNVIYAGGLDGKLQAWDAKTGRCLWVSQHAHHNMVRAIDCFQGRIVTGGYDKTLKVWDASTGRCLLTFHSGHDGFIFKVLVSRTRIVRQV